MIIIPTNPTTAIATMPKMTIQTGSMTSLLPVQVFTTRPFGLYRQPFGANNSFAKVMSHVQ